MTPSEFNARLLDPLYDGFGIALRLIPRNGQPVDVVAIDKTAGVQVETSQFSLDSLKPAFAVRLAELATKGVAVAAIADGQVVTDYGTAAAKTWRINAPRERRGEVLLIVHEEK